ncbi:MULTISPECIES: hypothetical protein [unclassified Mesorhizobium]
MSEQARDDKSNAEDLSKADAPTR